MCSKDGVKDFFFAFAFLKTIFFKHFFFLLGNEKNHVCMCVCVCMCLCLNMLIMHHFTIFSLDLISFFLSP